MGVSEKRVFTVTSGATPGAIAHAMQEIPEGCVLESAEVDVVLPSYTRPFVRFVFSLAV